MSNKKNKKPNRSASRDHEQLNKYLREAFEKRLENDKKIILDPRSLPEHSSLTIENSLNDLVPEYENFKGDFPSQITFAELQSGNNTSDYSPVFTPSQDVLVNKCVKKNIKNNKFLKANKVHFKPPAQYNTLIFILLGMFILAPIPLKPLFFIAFLAALFMKKNESIYLMDKANNHTNKKIHQTYHLESCNYLLYNFLNRASIEKHSKTIALTPIEQNYFNLVNSIQTNTGVFCKQKLFTFLSHVEIHYTVTKNKENKGLIPTGAAENYLGQITNSIITALKTKGNTITTRYYSAQTNWSPRDAMNRFLLGDTIDYKDVEITSMNTSGSYEGVNAKNIVLTNPESSVLQRINTIQHKINPLLEDNELHTLHRRLETIKEDYIRTHNELTTLHNPQLLKELDIKASNMIDSLEEQINHVTSKKGAEALEVFDYNWSIITPDESTLNLPNKNNNEKG